MDSIPPERSPILIDKKFSEVPPYVIGAIFIRQFPFEEAKNFSGGGSIDVSLPEPFLLMPEKNEW